MAVAASGAALARRMPLALVCLLTVLLALAGCSSKTTAPALPRIAGAVQLRGLLRDVAGNLTGLGVIDGADGLALSLWRPGGVVARTTSTHGVYGFAPAAGDSLRVGWGLTATDSVRASSPWFAYDGKGLVERDTLRVPWVESDAGQVVVFPNPVYLGATCTFQIPAAGTVEFELDDLAGRERQYHLIDNAQPGDPIPWTAVDDHGDAIPPGPYWVNVRYDGRAIGKPALVFVRYEPASRAALRGAGR